MFAVQLKYLLLFFASLCLLADLSNETSSNDTCYFMNKQSNETWKLKWQDNFQSDDVLKRNWDIGHGDCVGAWNYQKSCSVIENVQLLDGCLVMSAKEEKYDRWNFTDAMLTTKRVFGYGRFEARAALSVDRDVWSYFYTETDNWKKEGYIIMHRFDNVQKTWHSAVFPKTDRVDKNNKFDIDYSSFHLYGMEWSENEVKFFVDDYYTEPILLNVTRMIKPELQIRLWLGVRDINGPLLDKYNWKCPLWIVDYVRVYEKVSNPKVGLKLKLYKDQNDVDQSSKKQSELVNSICANKKRAATRSITQTSPVTQKTTRTFPTTHFTTITTAHQPNIINSNSTIENLSSPFPFWSNINTIVYVTFGIATLLFITFIVRLRYRINKLKQPKVTSPHFDEIELEERHQYETINYDDMQETNVDKHEYLSMCNVNPSTISQCLSLESDDE